MLPYIVIPVRPFDQGKSRMASSLSVAERVALNQRFFTHVLSIACRTLPPSQCLVVSRSAVVLDQANAVGALAIAETYHNLNAALSQASDIAESLGVGRILALSTDLPLLTQSELVEMFTIKADVVIAPDAGDMGTNALLLARPGLIPYRYGKDSFSAHCASAEAAGLKVSIFKRPGLAHDMDTPADLQFMH
ncbi:MAG: 2-phospho-L-lactate guanylyltransferase [Alphaproteobacteria bacterium]|nr:2-phospho-L-lactate guanylyltransferase [Alphaproteobacteria bacterium]